MKQTTGIKPEGASLTGLGFSGNENVHWNLSPANLIEETIKLG